MKQAPIIGSSQRGPADNAKSKPRANEFNNLSSVSSCNFKYYLNCFVCFLDCLLSFVEVYFSSVVA